MKPFGLCPACNGSGTELLDAFRGQVVEPELAADPEFIEDYMAGAYSQVCRICNGKRALNPQEFAEARQRMRDRAEDEHNERMGY